ncbi:MAG: hypothetical protein ACJA0H_000490 [Francisellaceae bacterium]|jgi:hypothetical protein
MSQVFKFGLVGLSVLLMAGCSMYSVKPNKAYDQDLAAQQWARYAKACVQSNILETDLTVPIAQRVYKSGDMICAVGEGIQ